MTIHWTQTDAGRETMRKKMKERWAQGQFAGNSKQQGKRPKANGEEQKAQKAYGRTLYSLAKHVRTEIHKHVRQGGELESLHTSMLALTDALMQHENGE